MKKLLPLLLLTGCVIGGDKYKRPSELEPSWLIDRVRILAVVAEPPEIAPGESSAFSALVTDPNGEIGGKVWFACAPEDSSGAGCNVDLEALSDNPTPEELLEAGVIGFEPGLPPVYVAPVDVLDSLPPEDRAEGLSITVQIAAFPAGAVDDTGTDFFSDVEVGYKRLIVSEATTPNQNPEATFQVDGIDIPVGSPVELEPGQTFELGVAIPDSSIEQYQYLNSDGELETRTEEPYATWYCTGGDVTESVTLYPYTQSTWDSPDDGTAEVTCWAVVRDRRGGQTWAEQRILIR